MWPVLLIQLKRNKVLFIFWLLILFLTFIDFSSTGLMLTVFSWLFLYRYNVEDKVNHHQEFFQTLPLSLNQKILLKLVVPFCILIIASLAIHKVDFLVNMISGEIGNQLSNASVLTFASIIAQSMSGYIMWGLFFTGLSKIFGFIPYASLFITAGLLAGSVYLISGKRKQSTKHMAILSILSIILILSVHISRNFFLVKWLTGPDKLLSIQSGKILLQSGDQKAQIILGDQLFDSTDDDQVDLIIDSFDDSNHKIPFDEYNLKKLIHQNPRSREKILEYVFDHLDKYPWLNHLALKEIVEAVLIGDDECVNSCEKLAEIKAKLPAMDEQELLSYLRSTSYQRQHFALIIIEKSEVRSLEIQKAVFHLIEGQNPMISKKSIEISKSWIEQKHRDYLDNLLNESQGELTKETKTKLKKYFEANQPYN